MKGTKLRANAKNKGQGGGVKWGDSFSPHHLPLLAQPLPLSSQFLFTLGVLLCSPACSLAWSISPHRKGKETAGTQVSSQPPPLCWSNPRNILCWHKTLCKEWNWKKKNIGPDVKWYSNNVIPNQRDPTNLRREYFRDLFVLFVFHDTKETGNERELQHGRGSSQFWVVLRGLLNYFGAKDTTNTPCVVWFALLTTFSWCGLF